MSEAGFRYGAAPFVDMWADWPSDGGYGDSWLDSLGMTLVSSHAQVQAVGQRAVFKLISAPIAHDGFSDVGKYGYAAALNRCGDVEDGYEDAYHPAGYSELLGPFHDMIDDVNDQLAGFATDYRRCMASAGYDVTDHATMVTDLAERMPDPRVIPPLGERGGAAWQDALDFERGIMRADRSCRALAHDVGYTLLAPRIADFEKRHASEITEIQAGWRALVERAGPAS